MERLLCDELLQEIFSKLPNSSSLPVSLVSQRWLHLFRTSRTNLSLNLDPFDDSTLASLSSLLSHYPFLSYLSIVLSSDSSNSVSFNDHLLCLVCCCCSKLRSLRFLAGPVSGPPLVSLPFSCSLLVSLAISLPRPLHLNWVASFPCLKEISISVINGDEFCGGGLVQSEEIDANLGLESVSFSGIRRDDVGVGWLWRSCKSLKKLQLKSCEGIGDGGSFLSFNQCLKGLQELEVRTSRSVVDGVLLKLADNCESLISLLVYDGGSSDGLLHLISNCRLKLRGCKRLTNVAALCVIKSCKGLQSIDIVHCSKIEPESIEQFLVNLSQLKCIEVEENKLSDAARSLAASKFVEILA